MSHRHTSLESARADVERHKALMRAPARRRDEQESDGAVRSLAKFAADHPVATAGLAVGALAIIGPARLAKVALFGVRAAFAASAFLASRDAQRD